MRCPTFKIGCLGPIGDSLWEQIDKEQAEKLALKYKVRVLEKNSERHEKDVKEMRAEVSHQSKRYNDLWSADGELLEKVQTLRSQVTIFSSGGRVESAGGWLGITGPNPEGSSSRPRGSGRQSGRPNDHTVSSDSWHERSGDGPRTRTVVVGGASWTCLFL